MLQCNLRKTRRRNSRPVRLRSHRMSSKLLQNRFAFRHGPAGFARVFASRMTAITLVLAAFLGGSPVPPLPNHARSLSIRVTAVTTAVAFPISGLARKISPWMYPDGLRISWKMRGYRVVMTRDRDSSSPSVNALRSQIPIATRPSFPFILIPRGAPAPTALRPIITARTAPHWPRISIATSSRVRLPKTAGSDGADILFCGASGSRPSSWNAAF